MPLPSSIIRLLLHNVVAEMYYSTRPVAKTQIAPVLEASTVKDVADVNFIPPLRVKLNWIDVFAAIDIGPISAVVTAPVVSPSPMVTVCAVAPLLMVKDSTTTERPVAGAAFNSSHPEASALVAFRMKPESLIEPVPGVVTAIAIVVSSKEGARRPEGYKPPRPWGYCSRAAIIGAASVCTAATVSPVSNMK